MGFKEYFSNDFTTSDDAKHEELVTRYYRNDYQTVKAVIIDVAKNLGYEVEDVNDQYKEILLTSPKSEVIVSIIQLQFYEMAVDFKITTHYLISRARGIKEIAELYHRFNGRLNLKAKGNKNNA